MALSPEAQRIVERVRRAKRDFGESYPKKFGGAAAVEILREELQNQHIPTSRRDVYIKGDGSEIDLLIPRKGAEPWLELLYEPGEVALALEVKKTGSWAEAGRDKVKTNYSRLQALGVEFAYITFEDQEGYIWRPKQEIVGCRCFALAWHKKDSDSAGLVAVDDCEDWEAFLTFVRSKLAAS